MSTGSGSIAWRITKTILKCFGIVVGLVVVVILAGLILISLSNPHTDVESDALVGYVRRNFPLPNTNDRKLGPTIYYSANKFRTQLTIYGIVSRSDQDRIVEIVRQARTAGLKKRVEISFKEAEKFSGNENSVQHRVDEVVLREVTVSD